MKKFLIREPIRQEKVGNVTFIDFGYFCPTCHVNCLPFQKRCECGQKLLTK